jgi:hypothetical protein
MVNFVLNSTCFKAKVKEKLDPAPCFYFFVNNRKKFIFFEDRFQYGLPFEDHKLRINIIAATLQFRSSAMLLLILGI